MSVVLSCSLFRLLHCPLFSSLLPCFYCLATVADPNMIRHQVMPFGLHRHRDRHSVEQNAKCKVHRPSSILHNCREQKPKVFVADIRQGSARSASTCPLLSGASPCHRLGLVRSCSFPALSWSFPAPCACLKRRERKGSPHRHSMHHVGGTIGAGGHSISQFQSFQDLPLPICCERGKSCQRQCAGVGCRHMK